MSRAFLSTRWRKYIVVVSNSKGHDIIGHKNSMDLGVLEHMLNHRKLRITGSIPSLDGLSVQSSTFPDFQAVICGEPAERLRRVLRCLCGTPMFSTNRVSVHPVLEWSTWVLLPILTIAGWRRRWRPRIVRPHALGSRLATSRPGFPEASLLLLVHPCLRTPLSALRKPFALSSHSRWIGT